MMYSRLVNLPPLSLPYLRGPVMMQVRVPLLLVLCLVAQCVIAQEQQPAPTREELDVTMQIIADPDAKLPDEVVRRIPLPARKPAQESTSSSSDTSTDPQPNAKGQERAREAQGLGREMSEGAKERAREAAEQREQARRAKTDERRNPGPPAEPPNPPRPTPPRP
jgi:hypothetical protein